MRGADQSAAECDLAVIGAGPAGISAANAAGIFGKRVVLIEASGVIGGAGINTGTIPSKTLRETALALAGYRSRNLLGVDVSLRRHATARDLMRHEVQVTENERRRAEFWLRERNVQLIHGRATFVDSHTLRVERPTDGPCEVRFRYALIATGSSPVHPKEFDFDDPRVHDSNEILEISTLPTRLVVIGAGVVGSEYASIFAALGIETHLVDGRDTLLPFLDGEVSRTLAAAMEENGVRFHWKERVVSCDTSDPKDVVVTLTSGATLRCDGLLVCAGRSSNTEGLGLDVAGVTTGERGLVPVDTHYCTNLPHIYAAGDVIGPPALAATSVEQARIAVCAMFDVGGKRDIAPLLPTGIYTVPEASFVGETEESLTKRGVPYVVGKCRAIDLPRGQIIGDRVGFLKLLFAKDDLRLLGVHAIGELATEIVHIGLIAMMANEKAELFTRVCFNMPTLGDLYKYAAYDAMLRAGAVPGATRR